MTADATARRGHALRAAVEQGLIGPEDPVIGLLDVTGVQEAAAALKVAFATPGVTVDHTFAVKAAALVPVLRLLAGLGIGAEVASPGELAIARAAGLPAGRIVLDSPAKTRAELREALALGIAVNIDNPQELARLDVLTAQAPTTSPIGLRINPQIGGGSIGAMSTATDTSKFGVALRDDGAEEWILRAYAERPWLNRLHTHTGSQGVPLELMAAGVRAAYELAERINTAAGLRQVTTLDIGGGLPVNFGSDEITPTFRDYAGLLRTTVPGLFDGRYTIVTEFGRSLLAKSGTVLARVEYAKSAGGRPIAVTHAGAQLATRTVFVPDAWPIRVAALDAKGRPKSGDPVIQDVAGPCCFAGDLLAQARPLPLLEAGDLVALLDTGAYYFSNHFAYNSLPRPAIYGYAVQDADVRFALIRPAQTLTELLAEGGAAQADALTGLG
ncbi:diaminopimelate decarboxylase [Streptomyces sp. H10-C2]|uniref:diaminopimelate decarboxylase n=1 Tax=unclassified Streptomyces TaxID=2593676 RepID=UPI0024BB094F|nr:MULTISPECIES: diaminopimelate decarboxylase [unclassified Streptomyces]MDJ0341299.1 diaminopimelate decarboxylase [Streptomyces sp. PH10-H1]MDJ0370894.1 diaminopimelate decarboxylase [Streptomyces sp. H10-C2]